MAYLNANSCHQSDLLYKNSIYHERIDHIHEYGHHQLFSNGAELKNACNFYFLLPQGILIDTNSRCKSMYIHNETVHTHNAEIA